jgi:hypothetical protein
VFDAVVCFEEKVMQQVIDGEPLELLFISEHHMVPAMHG